MSRIHEDSPEYKKRFIILPHEVIEPLYSWHGGQGSAVYSLASAGSENLVSPAMIENALSELEGDLSREKKHVKHHVSKRWKELDWLVGELDMVLSSPREFSAREAGMDIEEDEYEYSPNPGGCDSLCDNPTHRHANPNRPPKGWWDDCVAGASGSARDPEAACGSLWFHKMSASEKRAATRRHEHRQENPDFGGTFAVVASLVALGAAAWWVFSSSPSAAATPSPSPGTPPGPTQPIPPAQVCKVNAAQVMQWGAAKQLLAVPVPSVTTAPDLSTLMAIPAVQQAANQLPPGAPVVVVLDDGSFWGYDAQGKPVADAPHRADYCQWQGQQAPPIVTPPGSKAITLKGPPAFWLP